MGLITKTTSQTVGETQISNRILAGTTIEGNIVSSGDFRIDGNVKGAIQLKGKLVIGEKGNIEGDVECSNATVAGYIKGKLQISELLQLQASARVEGDIITTRLSVEPGAEFTGSCKMGVVREMKKDNQSSSSERKRSAS